MIERARRGPHLEMAQGTCLVRLVRPHPTSQRRRLARGRNRLGGGGGGGGGVVARGVGRRGGGVDGAEGSTRGEGRRQGWRAAWLGLGLPCHWKSGSRCRSNHPTMGRKRTTREGSTTPPPPPTQPTRRKKPMDRFTPFFNCYLLGYSYIAQERKKKARELLWCFLGQASVCSTIRSRT